MSLSSGLRLGPYEIVSELGKGGMGVVYRARDVRLNRDVAMKVLPEHLVNNPDALRRFEREAKALAALSHPNILSIFDVGADQGISYVVMELLEGETLRSRIPVSGIPWQKVLDLAVPIAEALSGAHSRGVVHRDLKPENIFLTSDDRIKILDFGLARLTEIVPQQETTEAPTRSQELESATVSGTVPYMSPEQITGKGVDARSDIFSFGCVLYEMLTGRRPFSRNSSAETIAAILKENPTPLADSGKQIPPQLERVVLHCLEKNPSQRFQTARDLTFALREISNTSVIPKTTYKLPSRTFKLGLVGVPLLVIAAVSFFYFFTRPNKTIDSVAILPFANTGGDPNIEYVSDGITEGLINNLSRLPKLRVMARTTVFTYKGKQVDPRKVGQELKVRAVLTGKLTQVGDTLIIQGELVDSADGSQLWGEQYNQKFSDILTVQGTIAKEIAEKLRYKITGEQEKLLTKRYTENTEAYQLYLKGRYFWNQRTPPSLQKSMEFYQQAINKDPNYALAYAGMADSYTSLAAISDVDPKECFPKAKIAVAKALELDDTLAEAHATMMYIKSHYDWDWTGVEKEYRRAVQLNPNYAVAHATYGGYLNKMKRLTEGIAKVKRAQELDPLSLMSNMLLGRAYLLARQYDQAIDQLQKTLEIDPNFFPARTHLSIAYIQKKMYNHAIEELSKASEAAGHYDESISLIGYTHAVTGKRAEAMKVVDQLKERSKQRYVSPYLIATIYAGLGDKDQTFEWLQKAYEDRSFRLTFIAVQPEFDNIRPDPRYADLLRKLNLPI
jgi:eukaryotic-like serine/threonine-protein kinase